MRPANLIFNSTHGALPDAVFGGDFLLHPWIGAYGYNLSGGKFCSGASLSSVGGSMFGAVVLICGGRIPAKVRKSVIGVIAVVMASLMPSFRLSYESKQDETMDAAQLSLIALPEQYALTRILFGRCLNLKFSAFYRANISKFGRFVEAFKARYWFPIFHSRTISQCGIFCRDF